MLAFTEVHVYPGTPFAARMEEADDRLSIPTLWPEFWLMTLQPERSAEGLRILVVDDNPDAANTLAKLLKALGHGVNVAYRGPAALEESREHHFDLIISDLLMPGMNGRELAAELREEASDRPLTIVALTGLARPQDQGTRQLFDRILLKPVRFDVLESLLSEVATRRGTGGPLRD